MNKKFRSFLFFTSVTKEHRHPVNAAFVVQLGMPKTPSISEIAAHAQTVFGMKTWIANAYANIACGGKPEKHSSTPTLRACNRLLKDDSGSVDPLVGELASEVVRLNNGLSLEPNNEATMHCVLDLLGLEYAEPEEKERLLNALGTYLQNHEFATDGHFRSFSKAIASASTPSTPAGPTIEP